MRTWLPGWVLVPVLAVAAAWLVSDPDRAEPIDPGVAFRFQDPAIAESSGLAVLGGGALVATVNDSGDGPTVYVVDARTGRTAGRTSYTVDGVPPEVVDVEAVAPGRAGSLWVGDIGDNGSDRQTVSLYRIPPVVPGDRTVAATRFDLRYADGPRDAEALLVHPRTGRVFVVSKGLFGGTVYAAPSRLRPGVVGVLRPVADVSGMVTDGAFLPGGTHAVLRGYGSMRLLAVAGDRWESLGTQRLPDQDQGEGIAVLPGGQGVLVSTEGERSAVTRVPFTRPLQQALAGQPPAPEAAPPPDRSEPASPAATSAVRRWAVPAALALGFAGVVLLVLRGARRRSRSTR